jgi:hypothetical protein
MEFLTLMTFSSALKGLSAARKYLKRFDVDNMMAVHRRMRCTGFTLK